MDAAVFYLTLDIDDALSGACVNLRQGESGRKIIAALRQSGRPYPIGEGCTAVFAGTRPDGQVFFKHCKLNQGKAVCDISSLITALPGCVKAEIRLYGENDVLIASPAFKIDIMECAMEEGEIAEGPEATALTELISQAQEAVEDCRATAVNKVEVLLTEDQCGTSAFVELDKSEDERIMRFTFSNLKGEKGDIGPQGEQGIQGPKGEKGEKGDPGRDGVDGKDGKDGRDGTDLGAYVTPTASGAIASFDDGADGLPVKSLVVDIQLVQDLNGYDAPWPPGGGKNLLDINPDKAVSRQYLEITPVDGGYEMTSTGSYGRIGYLIDGLVVGGTYILSMLVSRPVASTANSTIYLNDNGNWDVGKGFTVGTGGQVVAERRRTATITTSTGKIFVGFYVSAGDGYPDTLIVKNVQLELGSTATAYEPYSNICPISGWSGAKVQRTGKNIAIFAQRVLDNVHVSEGITYTPVSANIVNISGTATAETFLTPRLPLSEHRFLPRGEYTLSTNLPLNANGYVYITGAALDGSSLGSLGGFVYDGLSSTFRINQDCYINIQMVLPAGATINQDVWVQLELGSTATTYEPYRGDTYDISFPDEAGTVYGGTLDVTKGVLTVDRAMWDLGELSWNADATRPGVYYTGSLQNRLKNYGNVLCSQYAFWASAVTLDVDYYISLAPSYNSSSPYLRDTRFAGYTGAEVRQALSGVQAVFELATPLTYVLTPIEVKTLLGVNNIYADTGDTEVAYRAEPTIIYNKIMNAITNLSANLADADAALNEVGAI